MGALALGACLAVMAGIGAGISIGMATGKATEAVTLISFVGGLKPKIPNMLLSPIKKRTEQIYGA